MSNASLFNPLVLSCNSDKVPLKLFNFLLNSCVFSVVKLPAEIPKSVNALSCGTIALLDSKMLFTLFSDKFKLLVKPLTVAVPLAVKLCAKFDISEVNPLLTLLMLFNTPSTFSAGALSAKLVFNVLSSVLCSFN